MAPEAAEWLTGQIGTFQMVQSFRPGSARTDVRHVRSDAGEFVLKLHRRLSHWSAERFAYENWIEAVTPYAPHLVASTNERLLGLLLTFVPGRPLRSASIENEDGAYRAAGTLLRRFHEWSGSPLYGTPDLEGALRDRHGQLGGIPIGDVVATRAKDLEDLALECEALACITQNDFRAMHRAADALRRTTAPSAVPTHPDYTPGNWMVDESGLVALIDFENMAWGHPADSLPRLALDYFPDRRDCEAAFHEGYGENLAARYPEWTHSGCLIYAGYYAAIAARTGDPAARERAKSAFCRTVECS